jgi:hypothetical protein
VTRLSTGSREGSSNLLLVSGNGGRLSSFDESLVGPRIYARSQMESGPMISCHCRPTAIQLRSSAPSKTHTCFRGSFGTAHEIPFAANGSLHFGELRFSSSDQLSTTISFSGTRLASCPVIRKRPSPGPTVYRGLTMRWTPLRQKSFPTTP